MSGRALGPDVTVDHFAETSEKAGNALSVVRLCLRCSVTNFDRRIAT